MKSWQIVTIPTEKGKNTLPYALGVSEERAEALFDIVEATAKKYNKISEILEDITGQCENINESILTTFMFVKHNEGPCISCPIKDITENLSKEIPEEFLKLMSKSLGIKFGSIVKVSLNRDSKPWQVSKVKSSDNVHDSLGIKEDRLNKIKEFLTKQMIPDDGDVTTSLENLSKFADNPNESAYMIYMFSNFIAKIKNSPLDFISKMIKELEKYK